MIQTIALWVLLVWLACALVILLALFSQWITAVVDAQRHNHGIPQIDVVALLRVLLASPFILLSFFLSGLVTLHFRTGSWLVRAEQFSDRLALTFSGAD